jgi:hypothetical protein
VPSNDPHSWLALGPNLSFKTAISPSHFYIFTLSVPAMRGRILPRFAPQGLVLIIRRLGDFVPETTVNQFHPRFFSSQSLLSDTHPRPNAPPHGWPRRTLIGSVPPIMEGAHQHQTLPSLSHAWNANSPLWFLPLSLFRPTRPEKTPFRHGDPSDHQKLTEVNRFTPWRIQSLSGAFRKFSYRDPRRRRNLLIQHHQLALIRFRSKGGKSLIISPISLQRFFANLLYRVIRPFNALRPIG